MALEHLDIVDAFSVELEFNFVYDQAIWVFPVDHVSMRVTWNLRFLNDSIIKPDWSELFIGGNKIYC